MVSFSSFIAITQLKANVISGIAFRAASSPNLLSFLRSTGVLYGLSLFQTRDFTRFEHKIDDIVENGRTCLNNAIKESGERVVISFASELEEKIQQTLKEHLDQSEFGKKFAWWFVSSKEKQVLEQRLFLAEREKKKYQGAVVKLQFDGKPLESGNWNEYNLIPLTRIHWRASLVPAAAVIPAPIAYI